MVMVMAYCLHDAAFSHITFLYLRYSTFEHDFNKNRYVQERKWQKAMSCYHADNTINRAQIWPKNPKKSAKNRLLSCIQAAITITN